MNKRVALFLTAVSAALILISLSGTALAQTPIYDPSAKAIFTTLPPHANPYLPAVPATNLTQWTLSWTTDYPPHNGQKYSTVIVGTDPSKTNTTTTVEIGIIPIKMVYGSSNGNKTFDPNTTGEFGSMSATQMINGSPLFKALVDYKQGGTDLGTTEYHDAYQRGNFWTDVKTNTNYHLLLKTLVAPEQTFTVPASEGDVISNPWSGIPTGTADINWFDAQLQTVMSNYSCTKRKEPCISPNVFPFFITENVYLTEGGCCIGGYHSANGNAPSGQTYGYTTIIQQAAVPVFSEDVSAAAHEVGEWIMDPFTTNASPCPSNSILEIGDPLETETHPEEFGAWPYTVNGFTYHPQDLVFLSWFGQNPSTAVNGWVTFQGQPTLSVCQTAN
ncbi:MAG TPA: hypothetical protein VMB18_03510 [Terriglobales bacterium]|nr:hypothetical protein [Terriglobales bacterium]